MRVDFNVEILNKLLYQNPDKATAIDIRFPQINEWKQQKEKPTINQLSGLAHYFNIPFGYFFLQNIPEKIYPIPHYRTIGNENFKPSEELQDTIETLKERQEWAKDLLIDLKGEPLPYANSIKLNTPIERATDRVREILKLTDGWAETISTWIDAFKLLVEKTEEAGIFVVINGVVNNQTRRKLNVDEFRGFVLYDNYAPFIFINNNDFISGKIFTLIHEIIHVLTGNSASFDFNHLLPSNSPVELYCDAVAAEFLVPEKLLSKRLNETGLNYQLLAKAFKVSRIVIARRLLDTNKITRNEFFEAYNSFKNSEIKIVASKGGDFYNTAPYRISKNFFRLIYNAVKQNKILYRDAFKLTGLTPKSFDGYINKHPM